MDIEFLLWLQGVRQSAPEVVQGFFSFLGSEAAIAIAMVAFCIIYWCLDKASGQFALLAYGASSMCNQMIKNTVCEYRPWVRDARVVPDPKALSTAGGYSLPSGHTQSSASLLIGVSWPYLKQRRWPLFLALLFTALVGFSRLFLGVHAPQDVLIGFAEGWAFVIVAEHVVPWLEARRGRDAWALVVSALLTLAYLVYVTVKPYPLHYVGGELLVDPVEMVVSCYKAGGVFIGIMIGWYVERHYVCFETGKLSLAEGALRLLVGALLALAAYLLGYPLRMLLGENIGQFIKYAAVFFVITAGAPAAFGPLGKAYAKRAKRAAA